MPDRGFIGQNMDGFFTQISRAVTARHDVSATPIGDLATVVLREWVTDHAGFEHSLNVQGAPLKSLGVELRPFPGGNGDFGQMPSGRAVLMHVPCGHQSIGGGRIKRVIRVVKNIGIQ